MDTRLIEDLRGYLSTKDQTSELLKAFIEKAVEEEAASLADDEDKDGVLTIFRYSLETSYPNAVEIVYARSESEIEKIFLNSLIMSFLMADPLGLIVQPPYENATEFTRHYREHYKNMLLVDERYGTESGGKDSGFNQHIDKLLALGEITRKQHEEWKSEYLCTHGLGWYHAFYLSMQSKFPNVKVGGKSIRPDIYVWRLDKENFNLIIECDGFKYHSDLDSFTRDRQRDRILKSKGFEVLRYSGSEIYRDPVTTAIELFGYLQNVDGTIKNES